jgi:alcohol dehydrogenase class IV
MYKLKTFAFDQPTKIISGIGSVSALPDELKRLCARNVMIVCDKGIVNAGIVKAVTDVLDAAPQFNVFTYDQIIANPLDTTMDAAYDYAAANSIDTVIGIGGGSSLDSAKGIALLMANGGKMREYLMDGKVPGKRIATTICIPTTAGTGSEVTRTIVATDSVTHFKDGFKYADKIFADAAILDANLMAKLPAHVLAACGMDALTHAIESYITWKSNPVTDALNEGAIRLIADNIREAYAQPNDIEAKEALLLASCITGIAFDQAGLGLAHCMGHPMGGLFNVPHGVACAMALPVAMEFNAIAVSAKMARVAELLGEDISGYGKLDAANMAVDAVRQLLTDLSVPQTLGEVGIEEKDIAALTKDAMGFPGMRGANPRIANAKDIEQLYQNLL